MDTNGISVTSREDMSQNEETDAADVCLAINGDREAYGRLYDRNAPAVRAVVVAVSGDFAAVEDLTQETFLRGYARLPTMRRAAGFRPWIQGVARMVARERLREIRSERPCVEPDVSQPASVFEACDALEEDEEMRRVLLAVAELPERERLAVHAYYFHERSGDQAAAVVGMSRSGFYAALDRAMRRLRSRLSDPSKNRRTEP